MNGSNDFFDCLINARAEVKDVDAPCGIVLVEPNVLDEVERPIWMQIVVGKKRFVKPRIVQRVHAQRVYPHRAHLLEPLRIGVVVECELARFRSGNSDAEVYALDDDGLIAIGSLDSEVVIESLERNLRLVASACGEREQSSSDNTEKSPHREKDSINGFAVAGSARGRRPSYVQGEVRVRVAPRKPFETSSNVRSSADLPLARVSGRFRTVVMCPYWTVAARR